MFSKLSQIKIYLKNQIQLIQNPKIKIMNKMVLTRSLVENYAIFNFLRIKNSKKRIELFQCFGDFEWYSHQIYYSKPKNQRVNKFYKFLITTQKKYPFGYSKYGRLIKRRLCKQIRVLIHGRPQSAKLWQKKLDLINSNDSNLHKDQVLLIATYMSNHLITKLPFPYRIAFGKSITFFVIKYSSINRNVYWLLADLSHGTLIENHLDQPLLMKLIQKILKIINSNLG